MDHGDQKVSPDNNDLRWGGLPALPNLEQHPPAAGGQWGRSRLSVWRMTPPQSQSLRRHTWTSRGNFNEDGNIETCQVCFKYITFDNKRILSLAKMVLACVIAWACDFNYKINLYFFYFESTTEAFYLETWTYFLFRGLFILKLTRQWTVNVTLA